jgi:hypothetical protein
MYEKPFMVISGDRIDSTWKQLPIDQVDTNSHVEEGFCANYRARFIEQERYNKIYSEYLWGFRKEPHRF